MSPRLAATIAGFLLITGALPAAGRDGMAGTPVRYGAPGECPDEPEFMRRVGQRTTRARTATPEDATAIVVTVESLDGGFRARMSLPEPAGGSTREVSGVDCDSVCSAMALITSLAVESAAAEAPVPQAPRCPPPPLPPPAPPAPVESARRKPDWHLGASLQMIGGVSPELMMGSEHFVEFSPGNRSFRASYVHGTTDSAQGGLEARTLLRAGRIGACPFGLGISGWSTLSGCVGATLGAVQVEGEAEHGRTVSRVWADATVTARWQLHLVRTVSVFLEGGALLPAVRYSYEFRSPDAEFHRTDAIAPLLAAGLRVGLP